MKIFLLILGCSLFFAGCSFNAQAQNILTFPEFCTEKTHANYSTSDCGEYRVYKDQYARGDVPCSSKMQLDCPSIEEIPNDSSGDPLAEECLENCGIGTSSDR